MLEKQEERLTYLMKNYELDRQIITRWKLVEDPNFLILPKNISWRPSIISLKKKKTVTWILGYP